jgi:hypothetical protein
VQFTLKQLLAAMTGVAVLAALAAGGYCVVALLASSLFVVGLIARNVDRGRRKRAFIEFLLLVSAWVLVVPAAFSPVRGCGRTKLSLMFVVSDAADRPIEGARVQIRESNLIAGAAPLAAWPGVAGNADSAGYVRLTYDFPATELEGLCEHSYFAFAPMNYRIYVDAPGFEPADMGIQDFLGDKYDLLRREPIKPIRIALKRTPAAPASE